MGVGGGGVVVVLSPFSPLHVYSISKKLKKKN